ncbi:MAG: hypothetical protein R3C68_15810 [Myxococcota bacterium]
MSVFSEAIGVQADTSNPPESGFVINATLRANLILNSAKAIVIVDGIDIGTIDADYTAWTEVGNPYEGTSAAARHRSMYPQRYLQRSIHRPTLTANAVREHI